MGISRYILAQLLLELCRVATCMINGFLTLCTHITTVIVHIGKTTLHFAAHTTIVLAATRYLVKEYRIIGTY